MKGYKMTNEILTQIMNNIIIAEKSINENLNKIDKLKSDEKNKKMNDIMIGKLQRDVKFQKIQIDAYLKKYPQIKSHYEIYKNS